MSEQTSVPAARPPRKGFFRFLFRTPLGILLLVLGVIGLAVAFAPQIAERFGADYASRWFGERYRGQLTVRRLDLGWFGTQTVDDVELKDQGGARVALIQRATFPGLWSLATSGGKRLGKISILGEATLYADPAGRTNLESALEPREAKKPEDEKPDDSSSSSASLKDLDAELDVQITRIYWADEHTREIGAPFVLEDVALAAALRPGQPMTAKLRGTLTGQTRSDLSFDARIEHPFEAPSSATPPKAEIAARVAHFPTALLDAVTLQGGRLKSLLGDELSLQLDARGTVQKGSFDLRVDYPHGKVRGQARLENGLLRSEGEGFAAEFDAQQDFVESLARPLLTGGGELAHIAPAEGSKGLGPDGTRIGFALSSFETPLGAYLEASAKGRAKEGLDALLAGTRARWTADLGDWILARSSALAGRGPLMVRDLELDGELKAPAEESSLTLGFRAANPSKDYDDAERGSKEFAADWAFGRAAVTLTFTGGATLASFTPGAALAPVHAQVRLEEVPTVLFDSIGELGGDLTRALGPKLALDVDATASIEAAAKQDMTWDALAARWRELARRASVLAKLDLRGSPAGEPLESLDGQELAVRSLAAGLELAPGKPLGVTARAAFETPAQGSFELDASLGDWLADPASKTPVRFSLASKAQGVPAKALDALAGQGRRIQQLLGSSLAFDATAQGTLEEGIARVELTSEKSRVLLAGRLQQGMFVNLDEPVLRASLQPDAELLDELVAGRLPQGSRLAFAESRGTVALSVDFLALPVAELLGAAAKSTDDALAILLAKTRLQAGASLRELVYGDEALTAAKQRIDKLALKLDLELRPGEKTTPLALGLQATSPAFGEQPIELHVDVPHAPELLEIASGAVFAPVAVKLRAAGLKTALLDSYAGGKLREPLGPRLDLTLDAQLSQAENAPFAADVKLELAAAGGKSAIDFKARVKDPFDRAGAQKGERRPADALPELDAALDVSGAGALLAFAPSGARDLLRELCGESIAARVKLAEGKPGSSKGEISLDAGGLAISGAVSYVDRELATVESEPLTLKVAPSQATLDRLLAQRLPAGAKLELADAKGALVVQLSKLRVPLGDYLDADPSLALPGLVENLAGALDATFPPFKYTHPKDPAGGGGAVATLRDVKVVARMQPREPATVDATGKVDATPPGGLDVHVIVEKPAGFAVQPPAAFPAPGSRAKLTAKLERFPSALLDVLAKQDGLLVDVLGPELEATVKGEYPDAGGEPLRAELHSSLGDIALESRIEDGALVSQGEGGLDAKVGLTPLFSKRIVGSLVPLLVQVKQDDPAKRTLLTGRELALPLDADLSKLSGEVVLDLGAVDYQLLPTLSQALSLTGKDLGEKNTVIKPIAIKIVKGVARYDSIPIKISGREVEFHGSANLANKSFELGFAVPLEMLGSKVESELEKVRKYLDPKLEVPLEITGSWQSPRVRLGKGFLEKVLKDAAEGALQDELEKGLGGLLGGGKKKKDG